MPCYFPFDTIVAIQILYFVVSISFLLVDAISSSSVSQVQEIEKQNEKLDKLLKKLQVWAPFIKFLINLQRNKEKRLTAS